MSREHKLWKSIYTELPHDGADVCSRRSGEEGFVGQCFYDSRTNTFRTYQDYRNRMVVTIWKHDEWYYNE